MVLLGLLLLCCGYSVLRLFVTSLHARFAFFVGFVRWFSCAWLLVCVCLCLCFCLGLIWFCLYSLVFECCYCWLCGFYFYCGLGLLVLWIC